VANFLWMESVTWSAQRITTAVFSNSRPERSSYSLLNDVIACLMSVLQLRDFAVFTVPVLIKYAIRRLKGETALTSLRSTSTVDMYLIRQKWLLRVNVQKFFAVIARNNSNRNVIFVPEVLGERLWWSHSHRRLVTGFPPLRPEYDPTSLHVGFVVDKVDCGMCFCQFSNHFH
jgi:hypothetical protein